MKSPDKDLIMTFRSVPTGSKESDWVAKLTFSAGSGSADRLHLSVLNGEEMSVKKGCFHFMGAKVDVLNGDGYMLYQEFIDGIHQKEIWLLRPGCDPVPGGLTFE